MGGAGRWRAAWGGVLSGLVGSLLAACGPGGAARPSAVPDTVERWGELELVTHTRHERGGDAARFAWVAVQEWSLRWQRQPVTLSTLGGLWGDKPQQASRAHAVFVIERPSAAVPDLLVLVGDPNNTGAFHLVTQDNGRLATPLLCLATSGQNDITWVTRLADRTPGPGAGATYRGPRRESLKAEPGSDERRVLRLGESCYLEPVSRQVTVEPPLPERVQRVAGPVPALISPDGRHVARLVLREDRSMQPAWAFAPLVSLPDGVLPGSVPAWQALQAARAGWQFAPIDRNRHQVPRLEAIDAAWAHHHWRWQAPQGGVAALVERPGAPPRGHRAWLLSGLDDAVIEGLQPGAAAALAQAVAPALGATWVAEGTPSGPALLVDGVTVRASERGYHVPTLMNLPPDSPMAQPDRRSAALRRVLQAVESRIDSDAPGRWVRF
jgi:hypothetical protein